MHGQFICYTTVMALPTREEAEKLLDEPRFAAKIERATITRGCEALGVDLDTHIANLIRFFGAAQL